MSRHKRSHTVSEVPGRHVPSWRKSSLTQLPDMKKIAGLARQVDRQEKLEVLRGGGMEEKAGAGATANIITRMKMAPQGMAILPEQSEDGEDGEEDAGHKMHKNLHRTISDLAVQDAEGYFLDEQRDGRAVRHLFQSLDINSDGEVSVIEFMIGIRVVADRLGPAFAITAPMELFSNFETGEDANDGGGITLDAFVSETFRLQHPIFNKIIRAVALDAGVECSPPEASTHHAVRSHKIVEFKSNSHTSLREHVRSSISRIASDMETYGLHTHVAEAAATRRQSVRMERRMSMLGIDHMEAGEEHDIRSTGVSQNGSAMYDKALRASAAAAISLDNVVESGQLRAQDAAISKEWEQEQTKRFVAVKGSANAFANNNTELERLREQVSTLTKQMERQSREMESLRMDRACMMNFCKEYLGRDKLLEVAKLLRRNQAGK